MRSKIAMLGVLLPALVALFSAPTAVQARPLVMSDIRHYEDYVDFLRSIYAPTHKPTSHAQRHRGAGKLVRKTKRRARHHYRRPLTPALLAGAGSVILGAHSDWPLDGLGQFDDGQQTPMPVPDSADGPMDDDDPAAGTPGLPGDEDAVGDEYTDDNDGDEDMGEPPADLVEFALKFVDDQAGVPPEQDPVGEDDTDDGEVPVLLNSLLRGPLDLGPFDEPPPADTADTPANRAVPEPAALALVGVALLAAMRRPRRARR